ncbi:hypothetical protein DPMN_109374 [Dreissena polymorpha]|uniref:Protein inscuteable homologue C-terminal domain-containing protein n=1 Tax=Dreissena polymorpha TaxID=45954 RepID=A0A9D4KAL2_DREPO|nr:hypothetical protein DPMN_109374 [Dreissena polymorpha]
MALGYLVQHCDQSGPGGGTHVNTCVMFYLEKLGLEREHMCYVLSRGKSGPGGGTHGEHMCYVLSRVSLGLEGEHMCYVLSRVSLGLEGEHMCYVLSRNKLGLEGEHMCYVLSRVSLGLEGENTCNVLSKGEHMCYVLSRVSLGLEGEHMCYVLSRVNLGLEGEHICYVLSRGEHMYYVLSRPCSRSSLRALATICCVPESILELEKEGGVDILTDILCDKTVSEAVRGEAAGVTFLLGAAAIANITFMDSQTCDVLQGLDALKLLIHASGQPKAKSLFVKDQTKKPLTPRHHLLQRDPPCSSTTSSSALRTADKTPRSEGGHSPDEAL